MPTPTNTHPTQAPTPLNLTQTALVLEGGAMRGVFTCGVLDWMMDAQITFPYVIGVSAGACNGISFISQQRGRAKYSNIDLLEKYHYVSIKHYIKHKNILNFDLLFDDFPNKILPFDFDTYASTPTQFEIVTTNCLTGKAEYFEEYTNHNRLLQLLRASSSMPIFSPIVNLEGTPMLDGGICDSIPLQRAINKGFNKAIVVQTRNKGYRKKNDHIKLPPFLFTKYPQLRRAINTRNALYNSQLDLVDELEAKGKIIVIRPLEPITIGRIETNTSKLLHFYNHGYQCAKQALSTIQTHP